jgi:hypothetical protein
MTTPKDGRQTTLRSLLDGTATYAAKAAMRISVSNWSTTAEDVDRSVAAILRAANQEA